MPDVHTSHCCSEHGCKYGDEDCTVTTGKEPQEFPCEECGRPSLSRFLQTVARDLKGYADRGESLHPKVIQMLVDDINKELRRWEEGDDYSP